jgi:hypothetical protein
MEEFRYAKRITKYDPRYRNEHGHYLREEWTSVSEIGRVFEGQLFTHEEYRRVERRYVQAAHALLASCEQIVLLGVEKHGQAPNRHAAPTLFQAWQTLQEGAVIRSADLGSLIELLLQEYAWCYLVDYTKRLKLEFGYDYYMYVRYDYLAPETLAYIEQLGLFVE